MRPDPRTHSTRWLQLLAVVLGVVAVAVGAAVRFAPRLDAAPTANGRIVYSNNTTTPQNRTYAAGAPGTFGSATATVTGAAPAFMVDRAAPTRTEHLAGYVTTGGVLYVYRWNGTTWINETAAGNGWGGTVTVGGDGVNGRRFDIAYEAVTGDAIVVYSNNTNGTNELRYRLWNGTTWTAATNLDSARLTAVPTWVKLLPRPASDEIALTVADNGTAAGNDADLTTLVWSGAAWGNEPAAAHSTSLYSTTGQLVQNDLFDMAWERLTGNLMVVFTQSNTAGQYYRYFSGTPTRSWGNATAFPGNTARTPPLQMFAASDPGSDDLVAGWNRSASANVYAYAWTGAAWSGPTTVGTTGVNPTAVSKKHVTAEWLATGGASYPVVLWATGTAGTVGYNYATVSGTTVTWGTAATQAFTGTFGAWAWMTSTVDQLSADTLMLAFSDANSDLWARQLVLSAGPTLAWTADSSAALTTTLSSTTSQNFAFAYDRAVTSTTAGTVTAVPSGCGGIAVTAPYTYDTNGNNTLSYRYRTPAGTGTWTSAASLAHAASPYAFTINGLTHGAAYDVEVTYVDADGVTGTATQTVGNVIVGQACTAAGAVTAVQATGATPSIAVSAPYSFDANGNNTLSYRYRSPSGTGAWTAAVPVAHAASPYAFSISGLTCGSTYDVEVSYLDGDGIGSGTGVQTVTGIALTSCTVAGTVTAAGSTCGSITVTAPYTQDSNASNTLSYRYRTPTGTGVWTAATPVAHSATPYGFSIPGLSAGSYDVEVTYVDGDAVAGTATQTVTNLAVTAACTSVGAATATPTAGSCTGVTVSVPFTGDSNNSSTTRVEYSATNTWPGTVACASVTGASPRSCAATGLAASTAYYFRVTFTDADGTSGTNPQVVGPTSTSDCRVAPQPPGATATACDLVTVRAPFAGDANANSTVSVSRGAAAAGPFPTAVCANVGGASPRTCTDTTTTGTTTYYYQVTFADADGVVGSASQVASVTTPVCPVKATTAGSLAAQATSCNAVTVSATFSGDENGNGATLVEYNTTNAWPGTAACAAASGASPRQCVVGGLAAGTTYWFRGTFSDADGVSGTNPTAAVSAATPACGADTVAPTITMLVPGRNAILSGAERAKVQVYDAVGLAATNPVTWQVDGTAAAGYSATGVTASASYACGSGCTVFEIPLAAQAAGSHYLSVRATDGAGNNAVVNWAFRARASGAGSGTILRRTHGSQLCLDCHNLQTHNSQYTSTTYGNWAIDCQTCHTPHGTANIYLVRGAIETPASGVRSVDFRNTTGVAANSYATPQASGNGVNVCEVCHTRTKNTDGTARARNSAPTDWGKHYTGRCTGCHPHGKGFAAGESEGTASCAGCHKAIWDGMTGGVAKSFKHTLGNVLGTNDAFTDTNLAWGNPLSANAPAVRSCVNTCHNDHPHTLTAPATATHENNVYVDATSQASRAAGSRTSADKDRTDFQAGQANGGMCLSCHRNPVDATHPLVDKAGFTASAHNYTSFSTYGTWQYTQHDGGVFLRNCTKCHSDRGDARPGAAATPFGAVHFSDYPSLLAGSTRPAGTPATFVCYNCHGNGTTGTNLSGKAIATQVAKARNHPSDADNVHDSVTESTTAAFGNTLGVTGRHSSCLDCHETHKARAGTHATPGNLAGSPLEGAWGAQLTTNPAFWTDTAAGSFTKKTIVAGADVEATLCFKCHTRYYWGAAGTPPTSPSGGFAETDVAKEFNPANVGNYAGAWANGETAGGFHPVLASAGSNLGAVKLTNLVTTNQPWSTTARNLMTCTDCHESDTAADPNGPHGSTAGFILRGPNTTWSAAVTLGSSIPAGTFCLNCHQSTFTNSRFPDHNRSNHFVACWNCHAAVPHGGPRPGMLVAGAGANANAGGTIAGWDTTAPYWGLGTSTNKLYLVSYPANNTTNWAQGNCGCNGTGH